MLLVQLFGVDWSFDFKTGFPSFIFSDQSVAVFINSYSNLFVYVVMLLGLGWMLTQAYHFHDTHVKPAFVLKLLSWNLTRLLGNTKDIYHKGIVWLAFVWLIAIYTGGQVLVGIQYFWVFMLILITTIVVTWYFIADVEKEVEGYENNR